MDEDWKQARLDELWEAYVLGMPNIGEIGMVSRRAERAIELLSALRIAHDKALANGNNDGAAMAAQQGRVIWQLVSLELGDWLLSFPIFERSVSKKDDWVGQDRAALKLVLELHNRAAPDVHRAAVDPECVLVPKWILLNLIDALSALDEGEVHGIFKPIKTGRHDDAWSWDQMRSLAAEHVAYLRGQGVTAEIARSRVAAATSIPEKTLIVWERSDKFISACEIAFEAGEMKIILDDNPDYQGIIDIAILSRLRRFKSEPSLGDFGREYRQRFGRRHNRNPSSGK